MSYRDQDTFNVHRNRLNCVNIPFNYPQILALASKFDIAEDAKDDGKLAGSPKLEASPPPSQPRSSQGGTDLSWSWRREVVFPPLSSGRPRRSPCCITMVLWTKTAAGIILTAALLLSRTTSEGKRSFSAFSLFRPPGGGGVSPGCADPERVAVTGAICTTQNPRFSRFSGTILKVWLSVSLKLANRCSVNEYLRTSKFSDSQKCALRLLIV